MAAAAPDKNEIREADRLEPFPHPRETVALFGHGEAERAFLDAYRGGRMHHAWLIAGPEGIGKATLAHRIARFVLTHPDPGADYVGKARDLGVDPDDPAARQAAALSHPDLVVLRRVWDTRNKRLTTALPIEEVRRASHFFSMTAAAGGWRVAIVDCADEMNLNAANALLKTLEEPPPRALLLLVSHRPGRLIATLRSRCRRLMLGPLGEADLFAAMEAAGAKQALGKLSEADRAALVRMARGSPRRALRFVSGNGLGIYREIAGILDEAPMRDDRRVHALARRVTRAGAEDDYELALSLIADWLASRVETAADAGPAEPASLARLAEVWEKTTRLAGETEIFHFDRRLVILNAFRAIAAATS
jgi:DNA polymerase-3 subunit delta'